MLTSKNRRNNPQPQPSALRAKSLFRNQNQLTDLAQQNSKKVPITWKAKFFTQVHQRHENIRKANLRISNKRDRENLLLEHIMQFVAQPLLKRLGLGLNLGSEKQNIIIDQSDDRRQKKIMIINGSKIEGTWKDNKLHGFTTIQYHSGEYFEGFYQHGMKKQGTIRFRDGSEYYGGFLQNLFHGHGCLKLNDQSHRIISCKWQFGMPEKKVKIEYPSGDIYFGEIKKLQKHGKGYLFFKNGSKYVGEFQDGVITGHGAYYENEVKVAEGMWRDGFLETQEAELQKKKQQAKAKVQKKLRFVSIELQQYPCNKHGIKTQSSIDEKFWQESKRTEDENSEQSNSQMEEQ